MAATENIEDSKDPRKENERYTPLKTAVVGLGVISTHYMKGLSESSTVNVVAGVDRDENFTKRRAEELAIEKATTLETVLRDSSIDLVINITNPIVHAEIAERALKAGKHVFNEKPLATTFEEGQRLVKIAAENNRRLACAPDTFLGPNLQTALQLIDSGMIGDVIKFSGSYGDPGPSVWHPNPEPFYSPGGGPVFDIGPYHLTNLVALLGPIDSVFADQSIGQTERSIQSGPRKGEIFPVTIPTNVDALIKFRSGVSGSLMLSFEVTGTTRPALEIYGQTGTIRLGFPGGYNGSLKLGRKHGLENFEEVPTVGNYGGDIRGLGVLEFARSIQKNIPSRVDAQLALHVLEAMDGIHQSISTGKKYQLSTSVIKPEPFKWRTA